MARYVVLSFEDNSSAEQWIKDNIKDDPDNYAGQLEGVFAKPTIFCPGSGAGGCSKGKRVRGWVQGMKYGWWVCIVCHKPSGAMSAENRMRTTLSQGTNLLGLSNEETPPDGEAKTTGREHIMTVFDKESW